MPDPGSGQLSWRFAAFTSNKDIVSSRQLEIATKNSAILCACVLLSFILDWLSWTGFGLIWKKYLNHRFFLFFFSWCDCVEKSVRVMFFFGRNSHYGDIFVLLNLSNTESRWWVRTKVVILSGEKSWGRGSSDYCFRSVEEKCVKKLKIFLGTKIFPSPQ